MERAEVQKLLDRGILEPSSSPFATNSVLVKKKALPDGSDGGIHVTSDMRRLNSNTVRDAFPTEDVKEMVAWLATKKYFSVMDVRDGYFNVRLKESARHVTAVRTVLGLVQYAIMAMGMKNSAAFFPRLVNRVYSGLRWTGAEDEDALLQVVLCAYLDDISVGSMTVDDHLRDLELTLKRTMNNNLRFKLAKCAFGRQEVDLLGHQVKYGEINSSDSHLEAFANFKELRNVTELLRFTGCLQFFASLIDNLSAKAQPLYDVLAGTGWNECKRRKKVLQIPDWADRWGAEQVRSFETLRDIMAAPEFLVPPRAGAARKLVTDASKYGVGVVLLQNEGVQACCRWDLRVENCEGLKDDGLQECIGVVLGLTKFRHLLHGEDFSVVTDHNALTWLMNLNDPRFRLARWTVEVQQFGFTVEHCAGSGELMAVPDALSRDTMNGDLVFCSRCMETVEAALDNPTVAVTSLQRETRELTGASLRGGVRCEPTLQEFSCEQRKKYGPAKEFADANDVFAVGTDGLLYRIFGENDLRIVVPTVLRQAVLDLVQGSRLVGHWGQLRTIARLRQRFWWPGFKEDVQKKVTSCLACRLANLKRTKRQARMVKWHPVTRFATVAVDVTEISPTSLEGFKKVVVIGDFYSSFMVAIPVRDETAENIATILLDRWISVFWPPLRLLSDLGKPFVSGLVKHLCAMVGTEKIETFAYHPETDGCVERFNRTLCNDLSKFTIGERAWSAHINLANFRYNCSRNSATKAVPYRVMFGVDAFEFDAALGLELRLEDEPDKLPQRLASIHASLMSAGRKSREKAATYYNQAVAECKYKIGDRVLLFHPPALVETGRKLRIPWLGPYRVEQKQSDVSYTLRSEKENKIARTHVNRLKLIPEDEIVKETGRPEDGLWPDSRRVLRSALASRVTPQGTEYQIRRRGRNGFVWVNETALPDVVKTAFNLAEAEGALR